MLKERLLDIVLVIMAAGLALVMLWGHMPSPDLASCQSDTNNTFHLCVEEQLGQTPFVIIENGRYTSWSNQAFAETQLKTREIGVSDSTVIRYQLNSPNLELFKYALFLGFCILLSFRILQMVRKLKWNIRKTATLLLVIALLFELIAFIFPHLISHVSYGRWLIISGLYIVLITFAIHFYQRIGRLKKPSTIISLTALAGLIIISLITIYFHTLIPFERASSAAYLCLAWLQRNILTIAHISMALLFVKIIHSAGWSLKSRMMSYGGIAVIVALVVSLLHSPNAGLMLSTALIIILLLVDMAIEEPRLNFLWLVVWILAICLYVTIAWFVLSASNDITVTEIFNYFSLSFSASMSLLIMMLLVNTYLLPELSLAKLRLPEVYMLRHKFELLVLGTLILSFVTIGGLTYLIEKSEQFDENQMRISMVSDTNLDAEQLASLRNNIRVDSFINGIKLTTSDINNPIFIPYSIHEHYQNESTQVVTTPFIYKKQDEDLVLRFGPPNQYVFGWYRESSLSKFLNVYVFLFLMAIGVVYLFTNYLTRPLSILGQQLYNIDLGKQNRRIQWDDNDELGHLIQQYNTMLDQLDKSAEILAQSERDHAWKEMAKQVAHEIKNPLTPMKLTIQHMLMRADNESTEFSDKVRRASQTLIEQIDNLTRIANNFSQFGQMPSASNDKVRLNEVVTSVHDLFRKREDIDIKCFVPIDDLYVFADKDHLIRILNNIVKNAIQAIPHDEEGHIIIKMERNQHHALISIEDNGVGISDTEKSKVFQPNFTTKSSGTGLGLAMCSKMVESMDGRIYFETQEGVGTTFFIEIPLMRIDANYLPGAEVG